MKGVLGRSFLLRRVASLAVSFRERAVYLVPKPALAVLLVQVDANRLAVAARMATMAEIDQPRLARA